MNNNEKTNNSVSFDVDMLETYNKIATSTNSEIKLVSSCGLHIFTGDIITNITKETMTISNGFSDCKVTLHDDKCVFNYNNINVAATTVHELKATLLRMYVNNIPVPSIIIDNIKYVFNGYVEATSAGSDINKATRPSFMNHKKASDETKNEKSKPTKIDARLLDKIKKDIAISIINFNRNNGKHLTYNPVAESFSTPDKFYKLIYSLEDMDQDKITLSIYELNASMSRLVSKCMITYIDDKIHFSSLYKNNKYKEYINVSDDYTLITGDDSFYNLLSKHIFRGVEYFRILMDRDYNNNYKSFPITICYDKNSISINKKCVIVYADDFTPIINCKEVLYLEKCIMTDDVDKCIKFIHDNHICGKDLLNKTVKFDIGDIILYSPYIRETSKMVIEIDDHNIICLNDGMFKYYHTTKTNNKYGLVDKFLYASCNINDVLQYIKNPNQYRLTTSNMPSDKNNIIFNYVINCVMTSTPECGCVANGAITDWTNRQVLTTFKINKTTSLEEPIYELTFDESNYKISGNYIFGLLQKIFTLPPEILHYTSKELLADKNKIIAAQNLMIYENYKFTHVEITETGEYIIWTLKKDDETYYIYEDLPLGKAYRLKKHYQAHHISIERPSDTLMMSSSIIDVLEFIKSGLFLDPIKHVPHNDTVDITLDFQNLATYKGSIDYDTSDLESLCLDFIISESEYNDGYTLIILHNEHILFIHSGYETLFGVFKVLYDFNIDILIKTKTTILSHDKNEKVDSYFVQVFKADPNDIYEVAVKYKSESNHTFIKTLFESHDDVIEYLKTLNV